MTSGWIRRLNLILFVIASAFFVAMLHRVGWANLAHYLQKVGYYWPLVLVPYGLFCLMAAFAWKILLPGSQGRPTLTRLFFLRLGGESINQLTPTASLGGEPFKAVRLQIDGVAWQKAAASVTIHKGITALSLILFIALSLPLAPFVFAGSIPHRGLMAFGVVIVAAGAVAFVILQFSRPCVSVIELLKRMRLCPAVLANKRAELATLDSYLNTFYRQHPVRCIVAFCILFLSWGVHAMEVYVIFHLLGQPVGWGTAVCFEGLAGLFSSLGFMIPGSLGIQDGGNILLALGLNYGAGFGAAFSIIRRLREVFWLAVGLLVIAREK